MMQHDDSEMSKQNNDTSSFFFYKYNYGIICLVVICNHTHKQRYACFYTDLHNVNLHPVSTYLRMSISLTGNMNTKFISKAKEGFWSRLKNFFSLAFPTEQELFERRLSQCKI